jgi:hypothetical protein
MIKPKSARQVQAISRTGFARAVRAPWRDALVVIEFVDDALGSAICQRRIEATNQLLITDRLAQKANRPGIEYLIAYPLIRIGGDEDNRRSSTFRYQKLLQLNAT